MERRNSPLPLFSGTLTPVVDTVTTWVEKPRPPADNRLTREDAAEEVGRAGEELVEQLAGQR
jgi:hypothetical protein